MLQVTVSWSYLDFSAKRRNLRDPGSTFYRKFPETGILEQHQKLTEVEQKIHLLLKYNSKNGKF